VLRCRELLRAVRPNPRDNPVATRHYDKGRSAQRLGTHKLARDPPQTSARLVISVPGTRTAARYADGQGHSVVDPVLKGNEAASFDAVGVEICEPNEFGY
jgi:hypothetical protein